MLLEKSAASRQYLKSIGHMDSESTLLKALVPVRRVLGYNVKPRVKADGTGVDLANVKRSMSPFDDI